MASVMVIGDRRPTSVHLADQNGPHSPAVRPTDLLTIAVSREVRDVIGHVTE